MEPQQDNGAEEDNPYYEFQYRKIVILLVMVVLCFCIAVYSISNGAYHIPVREVIDKIFFPDKTTGGIVIHSIRLPRILAAVLVGCALAIGGAVMQCVLKNPLASPYTLGISNAAAFGAALAIASAYVGLNSGWIRDLIGSTYGMSVFAFAFSMIAVVVVLAFARTAYSTPETMVLAGTALASIFSAALSSLQYFVDEQTLSEIVYWQFGDLSKATWEDLGIIFAVLVPISLYFYYHRLDYNAMAAGDEVAESLGIKAHRLTAMTMILASVLAAVSISSVGIIGFIGLLGPHIMRRIIGNDHRFLLPASMIMGALVLLVADAVGRLAFGSAVPVGIITSFLGGPLFLYILVKRRRRPAR